MFRKFKPFSWHRKPQRSEQFVVRYLRAMFLNEIAICSSLEVNNSMIWPLNFLVRLKLFPCLISSCRLCSVPLESMQRFFSLLTFNWRWIAECWYNNSNVPEALETFKMPINRIERIVVRGWLANLLCKRLCAYWNFKFNYCINAKMFSCKCRSPPNFFDYFHKRWSLENLDDPWRH